MDEAGEMLAIGVAANVRQEIARGEGGLDIQRGTKHFRPGAKVWVLPVHWGDGGEQVVVVGRHRGSRGPYIKMVLPSRHLENFRIQGVYSPALLAAMERPMRMVTWATARLWPDEATAQYWVGHWNRPRLWAYFEGTPGAGVLVGDPPPLDVEYKGRTYYLAHFNANRASYSLQPPPREPGAGEL